MSVKVHEAFSLDSFQDRLLWFDDFHGDQLQDEWNVTAAGIGSVAVVDAQTGGIVRLTTGNVNGNETTITWGSIRTLLVSKKVTAEYRVKLNQVTNVNPWLSLLDVFNDQIRFSFNAGGAATNWLIECRSGGVPTSADSGVLPDTDYHIYRIEAFPTGEVHFYIDGTETNNSPITTNIPSDHLQVRPNLIAREAAQKSMDIDYIYVRQER